MLKDVTGKKFKVGQKVLYLFVADGKLYHHLGEIIDVREDKHKDVDIDVEVVIDGRFKTCCVSQYESECNNNSSAYERVVIIDDTKEFSMITTDMEKRFELMDIE